MQHLKSSWPCQFWSCCHVLHPRCHWTDKTHVGLNHQYTGTILQSLTSCSCWLPLTSHLWLPSCLWGSHEIPPDTHLHTIWMLQGVNVPWGKSFSNDIQRWGVYWVYCPGWSTLSSSWETALGGQAISCTYYQGVANLEMHPWVDSNLLLSSLSFAATSASWQNKST